MILELLIGYLKFKDNLKEKCVRFIFETLKFLFQIVNHFLEKIAFETFDKTHWNFI